MKDILDLVGRFFLSLTFVLEVYDSLKSASATKLKMTQYGITWNQDFLFNASAVFLILGSILLLLGYRSKLGAFLLLLYWLPIAFFVHAWWLYPDKTVQHEQSILFMRDMAIAGGLLIVMANGSGRYSIKRILATTRV
ncbi:MAG: DoxX family membrane protein [Saprospiraceae bacterium]|nr:DoxX family membrane protein [Saprospiraceae bacterium]MBP7679530.1 DoxX family membrane protein [Saprospiraceae bacterium]